jgi:hypothetical protein
MKNIFTLIILLPVIAMGQITFEPNPMGKVMILLSTTFSVNHDESEKEQTLIRFLDDSYALNWNVTLRSAFFTKDEFAVGAYLVLGQNIRRQSYKENDIALKNEFASWNFGVAPFIRNYLPLGKSQFALFNQTSLEFVYGRGIRQIENAEDITRNLSDSYTVTLALQPGITALITPSTSFEIGTQILGVSSQYTKTRVNNDPDLEGYMWTNEVSFDVDLLSLFLGITFYFPS